MHSKTTQSALLGAALLFLATTTLTGQSRPASIFERLTPSEGVQLTLYTDVSALMAEKFNTEYQAGTLTAADGTSYKVEVKSRGKFRRKIAAIPPLKLKFKKKLLQADGLDTLNEVKLVLPCTLDEKGDELVVREYLAYRMFEQISPAGVRARLINLTLLNAGLGNDKKFTVKAILLEDEEETVARLDGELVESYGITPDSLEPAQAALTAVFQYMIGNTDWSVAENRNVRFVREASGKILLVPFDFDFCGLVNAPYASPTAGLGLKSVRERYLMADGIPQEAIDAAIRVFQTAKPDFYGLCQSGLLSPAATSGAVEYLDGFYRKLEKSGLKHLR